MLAVCACTPMKKILCRDTKSLLSEIRVFNKVWPPGYLYNFFAGNDKLRYCIRILERFISRH